MMIYRSMFALPDAKTVAKRGEETLAMMEHGRTITRKGRTSPAKTATPLKMSASERESVKAYLSACLARRKAATEARGRKDSGDLYATRASEAATTRTLTKIFAMAKADGFTLKFVNGRWIAEDTQAKA